MVCYYWYATNRVSKPLRRRDISIQSSARLLSYECVYKLGEGSMLFLKFISHNSLFFQIVSGGNVTLGVDTLLEYGVAPENIYILTLFTTPTSK